MLPYFLKSKLGLLNFLLLQWFTLRLELTTDLATGKTVSWRVLKGIVPLTGWWSRYRKLW